MTDNLNYKKIYKYGNCFFNFDELYEIYNGISFDKKKLFKDCIAHFTLEQIIC